MEREEPRLGAPNLSEIDFRRGESRSIPVAPRGHDLWWQIALGVFIALMAHSMIVGLYVRWEINQATKAMSADLAKGEAALARQIQAISDQAQHPVDDRPWPRSARVAPAQLRDGERCIRGERFERLENGWKHLPHQPC